jgi:hypothetical protein
MNYLNKWISTAYDLIGKDASSLTFTFYLQETQEVIEKPRSDRPSDARPISEHTGSLK